MRNKSIDFIKGIAIISIIAAHCNSVDGAASQMAAMQSLFLSHCGTFGVMAFFIMSGALAKARGFGHRLRRLMIPWFVSATCVFLYVFIRKPTMNAVDFLAFLSGWSSYLYYVTMLVLFQLLYAIHFFEHKTIRILSILVTAISILAFPQKCFIPEKMDPTNWIGFYCLGVSIQKNACAFEALIKRYLRLRWLVYLVLVILICVGLSHGRSGNYFIGINAVESCCGALSIILCGIRLSQLKDGSKLCKLLLFQGRESLFIYLWHMPIAGIVARVMNTHASVNIVVLRPFLVLAIMHTAMLCIRLIDRKVYLRPILGITAIG